MYQIWIKLASWFCNSVFLNQISRKLSYSMHLYFITIFENVQIEESKPLNRRRKTKKLSQTLRVYNSEVGETILLIWYVGC